MKQRAKPIAFDDPYKTLVAAVIQDAANHADDLSECYWLVTEGYEWMIEFLKINTNRREWLEWVYSGCPQT